MSDSPSQITWFGTKRRSQPTKYSGEGLLNLPASQKNEANQGHAPAPGYRRRRLLTQNRAKKEAVIPSQRE
jgi:hypothetical protein